MDNFDQRGPIQEVRYVRGTTGCVSTVIRAGGLIFRGRLGQGKLLVLLLSSLVMSGQSTYLERNGLLPSRECPGSICIRRTMSCVTTGFSGQLGVGRLTSHVKIGHDCLADAFGGDLKYSPRRCLVGLHVRGTGSLLGGKSVRIGRITTEIKCKSPLTFSGIFGTEAKEDPERCGRRGEDLIIGKGGKSCARSRP